MRGGCTQTFGPGVIKEFRNLFHQRMTENKVI
jgi:hypothetical protein